MSKVKQKLITLNDLVKSKRIWWLKSYPAIKKWVEKDIDHKNHLKTIKVGEGKRTRYYFTKENVEKYVRAFEKGKF